MRKRIVVSTALIQRRLHELYPDKVVPFGTYGRLAEKWGVPQARVGLIASKLGYTIAYRNGSTRVRRPE